MPDTLEASLTRALGAAADAAPEPAPDLAASLTRRHHQRSRGRSAGRSRLLIVAAAGAVFLVLATSIVAVRLLRPETAAPAASPSAKAPVLTTGYPDGAKVSDVWPAAVRRLSDTSRSLIAVQRILPGGQLLVSGPGLPITVVDSGTGATRAVSPAGQKYDAIAQAANPGGEKWIVWSVRLTGSVDQEIWRAPSAGGPAVKVATIGVKLRELRLSILDDTVLIDPETWIDGHQNFGVLRLALDGPAAPAVLPGSHDYRYLQWPWFGSTTVMNNSTLWNAETGEKRTTPLTWKSLSCSVSWCVGLDGGAVTVARHDGSGVRKLAGRPANAGQRIVADRFVINLIVDGWSRIYDAEAGRYLLLPGPDQREGWDRAQVAAAASTNPFILWTVTTPNEPATVELVELGKMR